MASYTWFHFWDVIFTPDNYLTLFIPLFPILVLLTCGRFTS
jgi:hypothetical protein